MMINITTFTRAHHEERISKGLRHSKLKSMIHDLYL